MRLWETESWRQIAEDKAYDGKNSNGAAFDAKGALYSVADDGAIRRYGASGTPEAKDKTQGGIETFSVSVHPDGTKLAVGFNDTSAVEVYDARALGRLAPDADKPVAVNLARSMEFANVFTSTAQDKDRGLILENQWRSLRVPFEVLEKAELAVIFRLLCSHL
jgi:hypothetical protein